jgi:nucleotide-binding universal stress UspA family protein
MELPKVNINKVLYATDLSENARVAFAYAVSLADLYGAELLILHVLPDDPRVDDQIKLYVDPGQWEDIKKSHKEDARAALIGKRHDHALIREVLDRFRQGAGRAPNESGAESDEILVETGHPVEQIVRVAEEKSCDLIVMGRHGYGALQDALMGGVARGVLRRSQKPVLLVKLPAEDL